MLKFFPGVILKDLRQSQQANVGGIISDTVKGRFLELNSTAVEMIVCLTDSRERTEAIEKMCERYAADREVIIKDIEGLLRKLQELDLAFEE